MKTGWILAIGGAVLIGVVVVFAAKNSAEASANPPNNGEVYVRPVATSTVASTTNSLLSSLLGLVGLGPSIAGTIGGTTGGTVTAGGSPSSSTAFATAPLASDNSAAGQELASLENNPADNPSAIALVDSPLSSTLSGPNGEPVFEGGTIDDSADNLGLDDPSVITQLDSGDELSGLDSGIVVASCPVEV